MRTCSRFILIRLPTNYLMLKIAIFVRPVLHFFIILQTVLFWRFSAMIEDSPRLSLRWTQNKCNLLLYYYWISTLSLLKIVTVWYGLLKVVKGRLKTENLGFFNIVNEHSLGINAFIIIELLVLRNKWISAWIYANVQQRIWKVQRTEF